MKRVALYAAALGIVIFAGFPFYWMLVTSFKQNRDLYVGASDLSHIPWIFNDPPTLEHVKLLLGQTDFPRWVLNTLVVVVAVVVITVAAQVFDLHIPQFEDTHATNSGTGANGSTAQAIARPAESSISAG